MDPRKRTYLDFNATAPMLPEVRKAILSAMGVVGNPSSVHQDGRKLRAMIENSRDDVARFVNCQPTEITFTSGGTEANAMAIDGLRRAGQASSVFCSAVEHPSVLDHVEETNRINVNEFGLVDVESIKKVLSENQGPVLVCVMYANNETGAIQPISEISEVVHQYGGMVLCDAVQAPGKAKLDVSTLGADLVSLSAHKIGGPQGVGALINCAGIPLKPILVGGGQEKQRRSGTENSIGIIGFGTAVSIVEKMEALEPVSELRGYLETALLKKRPESIIVARDVLRLPNTTCVASPGLSSEQQVISLDLAGFSVSAGSACSSGKVAKSHVLAAMGFPPEIVESAIRISIGPSTTKSELDSFVETWASL